MKTKNKVAKRRPAGSGSGKKPHLKHKLFPLVGVGASAGGFEAFKQLLQALAPDTGMAFILVQHLDPTHDSQLTELLSRVTPMPVLEARNRMPIEPDHVYVLAPNTSVEIQNGNLKVTRRKPDVTNLPVNTFFESLAKNRGQKAIGIVLSGTAHDGSEGVRAIKLAGGITFAESLDTAKYPGMPESAVATGCVDFVLSPTAIARELAKLGPDIHVAATAAAPSLNEQTLLPCFELLWMRCGVNFAHYKPATVHRRIQRRMAVHHIKVFPEYLALLQAKPEELDALFSDLLIHVTLIDQQDDLTVCGEASDMSGGMTAAINLDPDAVVVDISLTSGSGIDLIKSIHAMRPDLPIMALSVHHENLYAELAIRAGARGYVMKRDPVEKLLAVLRALLAGEPPP